MNPSVTETSACTGALTKSSDAIGRGGLDAACQGRSHASDRGLRVETRPSVGVATGRTQTALLAPRPSPLPGRVRDSPGEDTMPLGPLYRGRPRFQ